jgi:hypothetical protein
MGNKVSNEHTVPSWAVGNDLLKAESLFTLPPSAMLRHRTGLPTKLNACAQLALFRSAVLSFNLVHKS